MWFAQSMPFLTTTEAQRIMRNSPVRNSPVKNSPPTPTKKNILLYTVNNNIMQYQLTIMIKTPMSLRFWNTIIQMRDKNCNGELWAADSQVLKTIMFIALQTRHRQHLMRQLLLIVHTCVRWYILGVCKSCSSFLTSFRFIFVRTKDSKTCYTHLIFQISNKRRGINLFLRRSQWTFPIWVHERRSSDNLFQAIHSTDNVISRRLISVFTARAVFGIMLTVAAVLATLLYFRKRETRAYFSTWMDVFSFKRGAGRVQYCRVHYLIIILFSPFKNVSTNRLFFVRCRTNISDAYCFLSQVDTTEEARLLLDDSDPTQCVTDSDDDLLHA